MSASEKTPGQIAYEAARLQTKDFPVYHVFDWNNQVIDTKEMWEVAASAVQAPLLKRIEELYKQLIQCDQCSSIAGQKICHGGNECELLKIEDCF